jgi:hypothetical protein
MSTWSPDTIAAIAASDDLHIAPFRADGTTYGTPTWIWSVVVGGDLYVRAYNGTDSRWYLSAISQRAGRIAAAGAQHEVTFEPADPSVADAVDSAYEAKYAGSPYLPPMVAAKTRAATVRITPRP